MRLLAIVSVLAVVVRLIVGEAAVPQTMSYQRVLRRRLMRPLLILCLLLVLAAGVAPAAAASPEILRTHCGNELYVTLSHVGGQIPDADPAGAVFGPIETPADRTIEDVILGAELIHSYIGDLRLWLLYDTDCDGLSDVIGQVLCRSGMDGCPQDGCCGFEAWLDGWYVFDDTAPVSIEDFQTGFIPLDCYAPDHDSASAGGLAVFDGLASGGCFWLWGADGAASDVGSVSVWEINLLYDDSPVESSSWGSVKALYR